MSRLPLRYEVDDLSTLSRSLRAALEKLGGLPTHLELLNMLARGAGFRNYQHFWAEDASAPAAPAADRALVEKVARHFDAEERLLRWPARGKQQELCLWVLWSRIPARAVFTEREISDMLAHWHAFGDHALLRRGLYDYRMVDRTVDGREYRRIEQAPPPELRPLLERIGIGASV